MLPDRQVLSTLRRFHPEFWTEFDAGDWLHLEEDGNIKVHRAFAAFSYFVGDRLSRSGLASAPELFRFIERVLTSGTAHAAHAACTCFLENLMNRVPREIAPEAFVPLLGPEARRFCRKWDAVTGYKTPGLWP